MIGTQNYPGPYCQALGITDSILRSKPDNFQKLTLTNGAVLEIWQIAKNKNIHRSELVGLMAFLDEALVNCKEHAVTMKSQHLSENKKKLQHKKCAKTLPEFLKQEFTDSKHFEQMVPAKTCSNISNENIDLTMCQTVTEISWPTPPPPSSSSSSETSLYQEKSQCLVKQISSVMMIRTIQNVIK
ncbi:hypothetical protein DPMN_073526 [Dreissena polymorpha]|uniref:Uncharacterized protein n=1 Tax=Dreissena polymorpha TaxID=45954 RepID=A0A9D4BZ82_DREPO|nr:hypothetical protein DPMN_073526 [Dreissena polymorpha]